ncbi:MAG TPA: SMI1/KNR4 family protein [Allosphingosinicella sp.]
MGRFIALWTHRDYPPDPVRAEALDDVERRLGMRLPGDHRRAILDCGLPRPVIALWDAIIERNGDCRTLGDFLAPDEIASSTEDWREMGLSEDLVAFASDGRGNLFCFPSQPVEGRQPVFFFDHDTGEANIDAPSFDRWIARYCELAPH